MCYVHNNLLYYIIFYIIKCLINNNNNNNNKSFSRSEESLFEIDNLYSLFYFINVTVISTISYVKIKNFVYKFSDIKLYLYSSCNLYLYKYVYVCVQ